MANDIKKQAKPTRSSISRKNRKLADRLLQLAYTPDDKVKIAVSIKRFFPDEEAAREAVEKALPALASAAMWLRVEGKPKSPRKAKKRTAPSVLARRARNKASILDKAITTLETDWELKDELYLADCARRSSGTADPDDVGRQIEAVVDLTALLRAAAELIENRKSDTIALNTINKEAIDEWIQKLAPIYETLTGKQASYSRASPAAKNPGKPSGPFLRFLQAASRPSGVELTDEAWAGRVERKVKRRKT